MSGGHHIDGGDKSVAILIAVLAAGLAICEAAGKSAQTAVLHHQIEASNLWSFFQAKTIRRTAMIVESDRLRLDLAAGAVGAPEAKAAAERQLAAWQQTIDRWESDPAEQEGRRELAARAKAQEKQRALAEARYHQYEYGSAALQLAIVLASASVVTSRRWLAYAGGGLGLAGIGFGLLGWLAPTLIHF
jgi:hypothetical protein